MNKPIRYTEAEKLALRPCLLFGLPDDGELQFWLAHHDNLAGRRSISVLESLCAIIGMENPISSEERARRSVDQ